MTYRMALKTIRQQTREGDTLDETFAIICRNRGCHPVRDWAIYDLAKAREKAKTQAKGKGQGEGENKTKNIDEDSVRRLYDRHLARLAEIFRVRLGDY